jgi:hypothetical protein
MPIEMKLIAIFALVLLVPTILSFARDWRLVIATVILSGFAVSELVSSIDTSIMKFPS